MGNWIKILSFIKLMGKDLVNYLIYQSFYFSYEYPLHLT